MSMSPKQQQLQQQHHLVAMGTGRITVYNVARLFPYCHELGKSYVLVMIFLKLCFEYKFLEQIYIL
jgi:hypothetical protein